MKLIFRPKGPAVQTPYKLLSLLFLYPDERIIEARPEILEAVAQLPASPQKDAIEEFCRYWAAATPTVLAQAYVETFDLQKRSGLYLSFYLHGDTRQRGMALLRLKRLYRAAGLVLDPKELPDYLPVMLEFAAAAPPGYGEAILSEYRAALALIQRHLREIASPYAHLLDALQAGQPVLSPSEREHLGRLIANGPPSEQVGLEPFAPPEVMPAREARR
ncbi:MAG TPA: nitrate reductase molybdenum cofactor assembly chaperone [Chloroflexota bacterium]|nr:nitrate reductase molybdenum cofactor assembly chaperone [Chloroflexota bacterium]